MIPRKYPKDFDIKERRAVIEETELYFIRHGETDWNAKRLLQGPKPLPSPPFVPILKPRSPLLTSTLYEKNNTLSEFISCRISRYPSEP